MGQEIGGLRLDALLALLKLTFIASGDVCRANGLAAQVACVGLATARHSSQVSQLAQGVAASSADDWECIAQSTGMAVWLLTLTIFACIAAFAAMSTAMMLPAQPRKGSRTTNNDTNSKCKKRCIN